MGLEQALILLYLIIDDGYRMVTFGKQQGRHNDASIHRYFEMDPVGETEGVAG